MSYNIAFATSEGFVSLCIYEVWTDSSEDILWVASSGKQGILWSEYTFTLHRPKYPLGTDQICMKCCASAHFVRVCILRCLLAITILTLILLNTTCPVLAKSVDPDQLASEEANWSGSALFVIKYVNFYRKPGSSNLIGWKLEVSVAS